MTHRFITSLDARQGLAIDGHANVHICSFTDLQAQMSVALMKARGRRTLWEAAWKTLLGCSFMGVGERQDILQLLWLVATGRCQYLLRL